MTITLKQILDDDRGAVIHFTALAAILIVTFLTMSYDLARITAHRIQLQHAADAAALEMAAWQSRGLNMIQHINDEVHDIDRAVQLAYVVAAFTSAGSWRHLKKWWGWPKFWREQRFAASLAKMARAAHHAAIPVLNSMRDFYYYGSNPLGYISANEIARMNGAGRWSGPDSLGDILSTARRFPIGSTSGASSVGMLSKLGGTSNVAVPFLNPGAANIHALGMNTKWDHAPVSVTLPLLKVTANTVGQAGRTYSDESPIMTRRNTWMRLVVQLLQWTNLKISGGSTDRWLWDDWYYYSPPPYDFGAAPDHGQSISPMIWIVRGNVKDVSMLSRHFLGKQQGITLTASAVAQAKGANVVRRNPSRRSGKGVLATPVLTPLGSGAVDIPGITRLSLLR